MSRFECIQCDQVFESSQERPRCPKCMRIHGVRGVVVAERRVVSKWVRAGLVGFGLLVVGGLILWSQRGPSGRPGGATKPTVQASKVVAALGGQASAWTEPTDADAAITRWAEQSAAGTDATERALALGKSLSALQGKGFVAMSLHEPRPTPPGTAVEVFGWVHKGSRPPLYPLEVAMVVTAAMRSLDVGAQVVEMVDGPKSRQPLDPSGALGYYAVAVPGAAGDETKTASATGSKWVAVDVYGAGGAQPVLDPTRVLTDDQVTAAMLGMGALTRLSAQGDAALALREVKAGLQLYPTSPQLRTVLSIALAANGGTQQAEREARAALQLRPDAARHQQLATLLLQDGLVQEAAVEVGHALQQAPGYAAARLVLAGVLMAEGKLDEARAEVQQAEQLDAEVPGLLLAFAQLQAASGDIAGAISYAERAVQRQPKQPQLQLSLGRLYLAADRADDAKACARRALELSPSFRRDQMKKVIAAVLGPDMVP